MVPPKMEDASGWRRPFQTRFGWAVLENHTVPHMNEKIHFKILGYFFYFMYPESTSGRRDL